MSKQERLTLLAFLAGLLVSEKCKDFLLSSWTSYDSQGVISDRLS